MKRTGMHRAGRLLAAATFVVALSGMGQSALAYQEAPMLHEKVMAGTLPPVEQRLPEEPEIVTPLERVGVYGGTIHRALVGASGDHNTILRFIAPQGLVRWTPDYSDIIPNLATSWEISDDVREYTFHLRRGLKWSDGEPFTTADIMFYVDDILNSGEYYPSLPIQFVSSDGTPMQAEATDDHTITFKFAQPNGMFLYDLASPYGVPPVLWAKHYCSQFVPKYNPDVDKLMAEYSQPNWVDLYNFRCGKREKQDRWYNPEKPTLEPWTIKEPYFGSAQRVVLERNPYFWQVDTDGNQLPYVDRVEYQVLQNAEAAVLAAIGGEIDMQQIHLDDISNRPVLLENAEKGHYRVFETEPTASSEVIIWPNLTHRDPKVRALLGDKEFRGALSLAIDRQEIIDLVLLGQGEPWQLGPPEGHPLYNAQLAHQHTGFDPDKANALLDGLGYDKRGGDGYRLDRDGGKITLLSEYNSKFSMHGDVLQLVARAWRAVGIDVRIEAVDNNFFQARNANWEHMIQISATNGGGLDPIWRPTDYVPLEDDSRFGVAWAFYHLTDGQKGEKPPTDVAARLEAYEKVRQAAPGEEQRELMAKVLQMAADAFEVWGISTPVNGQGVVKEGLHNVPDGMPNGFIYLTPQPTLPATYFYAEE